MAIQDLIVAAELAKLAREHALAGADLLLVVTNDGWYGREAADAPPPNTSTNPPRVASMSSFTV